MTKQFMKQTALTCDFALEAVFFFDSTKWRSILSLTSTFELLSGFLQSSPGLQRVPNENITNTSII